MSVKPFDGWHGSGVQSHSSPLDTITSRLESRQSRTISKPDPCLSHALLTTFSQSEGGTAQALVHHSTQLDTSTITLLLAHGIGIIESDT